MTDLYSVDYFIAVIILGIMLLSFVVILRLFRSKGRNLWNRGWLGSKNSLRLKITEGAQLDQKRRLLIVGCDDTEYLLLIGGQNDLLLEKIKNYDDDFSSQLPKSISSHE